MKFKKKYRFVFLHFMKKLGIKKKLFIYLAAPSLSCGIWDFRSSLKHAGSFLPEVCEIFSYGTCEVSVAECGI